MAVRAIKPVLLLILLGLLSSHASADGKAFTVTARQPTMPDQRAMIVFDGSTETLLIDTTIEGAEGAAAWVVPVPAEPEVFEVDRGLFPTLQVVMQPRVLDRREVPSAAVLLGMAACAVFFAAVLRGLGRRWGWVMAVLFAGAVVVLLLFPAMGKARATPRGPISSPRADQSGVEVQRHRIGIYDTAVLHGTESGGVVRWLESEGFQLDTDARGAIDAYDADGWWFAASKLGARADEAGEALAPHPLGLRFAATEPVYPMRLTGTQTTDVAVDLYVFGLQQFEAAGFASRRCARVEKLAQNGDSQSGWRHPRRQHLFPGEEVAIGHRQLQELIGEATTATWLEATLSPSQMRQDVRLASRPTRLRGNTTISGTYAAGRAWTGWAGCLFIGSIIMLCVWRPGIPNRLVGRLAAGVLFLAPAAVATATYAFDPGVPIKRTTSPFDNHYGHQDVVYEFWLRLDDYEEELVARAQQPSPADMESLVREWLPAIAQEGFGHEAGQWQNDILATPMREAAEPGGYRIWHDDRGVWYAYYDLAGQEIAERIWALPAADGEPALDN